MGNLYGLVVISIKEVGNRINRKEAVNYNMQKVINITEIGKMVKKMDKDSLNTGMVIFIKVNGQTIN